MSDLALAMIAHARGAGVALAAAIARAEAAEAREAAMKSAHEEARQFLRQRDAMRAEKERLLALLRNAREWNWIDFEENCDNEEYLVCIPRLVKLNAEIDEALKGGAK